ncbi:MAG: hypothetical protein ACOH18_00085 [Candidatus Saccharimonadaceae bacterium]
MFQIFAGAICEGVQCAPLWVFAIFALLFTVYLPITLAVLMIFGVIILLIASNHKNKNRVLFRSIALVLFIASLTLLAFAYDRGLFFSAEQNSALRQESKLNAAKAVAKNVPFPLYEPETPDGYGVNYIAVQSYGHQQIDYVVTYAYTSNDKSGEFSVLLYKSGYKHSYTPLDTDACTGQRASLCEKVSTSPYGDLYAVDGSSFNRGFFLDGSQTDMYILVGNRLDSLDETTKKALIMGIVNSLKQIDTERLSQIVTE